MTMHIITLSGFNGAGKDTAAGILYAHYRPETLTSLSFSASLRKTVCAAFGLSELRLSSSDPEDRAWRESPDPHWSRILGRPFSPRNAMELSGTDLFRQYVADEFWAARVERDLTRLAANPPLTPVVITDLRHAVEYSMLQKFAATYGAKLTMLRIRRPEAETKQHTVLMEVADACRDGALLESVDFWANEVADACEQQIEVPHRSMWEHLYFSDALTTVMNDGQPEDLRFNLIQVLNKKL